MKGLQVIAGLVGDSGCYLIALGRIIEKYTKETMNIMEIYRISLEKGWINSECLIIDGAMILTFFTKLPWKQIMNKQGESSLPLDTKLLSSEEEITRYQWTPKPMTTLGHFVNTDGLGNVIADSMGDESPVVKNGVAVSKRIFRRI